MLMRHVQLEGGGRQQKPTIDCSGTKATRTEHKVKARQISRRDQSSECIAVVGMTCQGVATQPNNNASIQGPNLVG